MILNTTATVAVVIRSLRARPRNAASLLNVGPSCLRTQYVQLRPLLQVASLATQSSFDVQHDSSSEIELAVHSEKAFPTTSDSSVSRPAPALPAACPGCGALSQEITANEAGYYSRSRKAVRAFVHKQHISRRNENKNISEEKALFEDPSHPHALNQKEVRESNNEHVAGTPKTPVCDRCHDLIYNNKGNSIAHPSLEALADSIAESPFRRNHVYHVLDAADFPMSLIPKVFRSLELAKPRSQNRRARSKITGKPTVSFIITRSDLLGSSKEMVDKLMPYFQSVLRSALGREGRDIRLGNVHLVSAKRGWWTKELKNDIWERGGGNWMVGKVNVGKSNLFPVLFPKGSDERAPVYAELQAESTMHDPTETDAEAYSVVNEGSLLPPAQPEVPFPTMPIVSNLPGTTASPIRLSFGNHKGELVDLPGLERGNLENHVHPDHRLNLVMQYRPNVKKHVIKPGQSLILGGGLVRITPQLDLEDRSTTMLAYPFVPIEAHVTATEKAIGTQLQQRESGLKSILADGAGSCMKSSGMHDLKTDVTRARAGALLRAKVPLSRLPFRVYSSDILIEGVGWVELVCQVRKKKQYMTAPSIDDTGFQSALLRSEKADEKLHNVSDAPAKSIDVFRPFASQTGISFPDSPNLTNSIHVDINTKDFPIPQVEIFSPNGQHVGQRKSLGASTLWEESGTRRKRATTVARPRKSMKGTKKGGKEVAQLKLASS